MPTAIFKEKFPKVGQGPATKVSEDSNVVDAKAKAKDDIGFTHPNLHRRINTPPDGTLHHKYELGIQSVDSFRTAEIITHDEESTTSEIP